MSSTHVSFRLRIFLTTQSVNKAGACLALQVALKVERDLKDGIRHPRNLNVPAIGIISQCNLQLPHRGGTLNGSFSRSTGGGPAAPSRHTVLPS